MMADVQAIETSVINRAMACAISRGLRGASRSTPPGR